jgi:hypothetical protein
MQSDSSSGSDIEDTDVGLILPGHSVHRKHTFDAPEKFDAWACEYFQSKSVVCSPEHWAYLQVRDPADLDDSKPLQFNGMFFKYNRITHVIVDVESPTVVKAARIPNASMVSGKFVYYADMPEEFDLLRFCISDITPTTLAPACIVIYNKSDVTDSVVRSVRSKQVFERKFTVVERKKANAPQTEGGEASNPAKKSRKLHVSYRVLSEALDRDRSKVQKPAAPSSHSVKERKKFERKLKNTNFDQMIETMGKEESINFANFVLKKFGLAKPTVPKRAAAPVPRFDSAPVPKRARTDPSVTEGERFAKASADRTQKLGVAMAGQQGIITLDKMTPIPVADTVSVPADGPVNPHRKRRVEGDTLGIRRSARATKGYTSHSDVESSDDERSLSVIIVNSFPKKPSGYRVVLLKDIVAGSQDVYFTIVDEPLYGLFKVAMKNVLVNHVYQEGSDAVLKPVEFWVGDIQFNMGTDAILQLFEMGNADAVVQANKLLLEHATVDVFDSPTSVHDFFRFKMRDVFDAPSELQRKIDLTSTTFMSLHGKLKQTTGAASVSVKTELDTVTSNLQKLIRLQNIYKTHVKTGSIPDVRGATVRYIPSLFMCKSGAVEGRHVHNSLCPASACNAKIQHGVQLFGQRIGKPPAAIGVNVTPRGLTTLCMCCAFGENLDGLNISKLAPLYASDFTKIRELIDDRRRKDAESADDSAA